MRVRFGAGSVRLLDDEVQRLGLGSVLALSTPGQAQLARDVLAPLGERCAGVHAHARMHVPVEVAETARAEAARLGVDALVAVGGGSAIGLAKAVALTSGLPVLAVPTTYAGSEMTSVWGLTEGTVKRTGRDPAVLPVSVLYDPELTLALPVEVSVTSALNAMAHAVEALYAPDRNPIITLMAQEAIRSLVSALPDVVADPSGIEARATVLYGAWLAGACLGGTTMSLHHKLCHALGGVSALPHAPTHAVVLPHVMAFNLPALPALSRRLENLLGGGDPATDLWELSGLLGAPASLRELGMPHADLEPVVHEVLATPYANPREVTADGVRALLERAWSGAPPADLLRENG
ncbi:maleylacetate reductase [Angustibacter sp. McL0619]|uniref:maleylacetate reductase n=1 Tax=Angustibacter sp. McL0619 TaxID=3415676 RepID=UPI003CE91BAB